MTTAKGRLLVATTSAVTPWGIMRGQLAHLRRLGWDVVLVASPGPLLDATAVREDVRAVPVPMEREVDPRADVASLRAMLRVFRSERPDVSMVSTPKAGLLGGLAAWVTRTPVRVYLLRGLRLETTGGPTRALLWVLEWIALHVATDVLVVSPSLLAETRRLRLLGRRRGVVLGRGASNGVDLERLAPTPERQTAATALRASLGLPDDAFVFGFVGRLTADKGVQELVEAFLDLARTHPDVWLLVVGPSESDAATAGAVRGLVAHPRVRATGWLDDPADHVHVLDALVLPTYREGFPNVVIEASAAGVAVVTTTATGAVDSVVDGETGVLVPPRDVPRLRAAMATLADDPERTRALGRAGRALVEQHFSDRVVWAATSAFLDEQVARRTRGRRRGA